MPLLVKVKKILTNVIGKTVLLTIRDDPRVSRWGHPKLLHKT